MGWECWWITDNGVEETVAEGGVEEGAVGEDKVVREAGNGGWYRRTVTISLTFLLYVCPDCAIVSSDRCFS